MSASSPIGTFRGIDDGQMDGETEGQVSRKCDRQTKSQQSPRAALALCTDQKIEEITYSLYGNVVPPVNYHFLHLTPVQTETSFGVSLFAKHRLLSRSGRGLSASLLFKTCR